MDALTLSILVLLAVIALLAVAFACEHRARLNAEYRAECWREQFRREGERNHRLWFAPPADPHWSHKLAQDHAREAAKRNLRSLN
jgi:hypothetical protein